MDVSTQQPRIAELAQQRPLVRCTSLHHSLDADWLREAYRRLRRDSAPGYDRQTVAEYGKDVEANLQALLDRAKSGTDVAPPVRRVPIPKGTGKATRPIGMPCRQDRAMQALSLLVLDPSAEALADPNSYGLRLERSTADAIDQCHRVVSQRWSAQWILEGDIRSCCDSFSHDWLVAHIPSGLYG
jgi:RNA-directed DNA polymerase